MRQLLKCSCTKQKHDNFNILIFQVQCCDVEYLEGIESIQKHVTEIRVHKSVKLLKVRN